MQHDWCMPVRDHACLKTRFVKTESLSRRNTGCTPKIREPATFIAGSYHPGGDEGDRTPGLSIANAALSHLSYIPLFSAGSWTLERAHRCSETNLLAESVGERILQYTGIGCKRKNPSQQSCVDRLNLVVVKVNKHLHSSSINS